MNAPYKDSAEVQALHIEHLITQYDHLLLVRDRHLRWMSEAQDSEIRARHQEIAHLMERTASAYEALVIALQSKSMR